MTEDIQWEIKETVRKAEANECNLPRKVSFQSRRDKMTDFLSSMRDELLMPRMCKQSSFSVPAEFSRTV